MGQEQYVTVLTKPRLDDYAYIVVRADSGYPAIEAAYTHVKDDGNLYFGPYSSKNTVDSALDGIREFYKILCSNPLKKNAPCLSYSLGLCIGVCLGGSAAARILKASK